MLQIIQMKDIINQLLRYIPADFEKYKNEEEKSFLYQLLYGNKDGNFDFYEQAKKLYTRPEDNPRKIEVRLEFPKDRTGLPSYVIREPGKNKNEANSIGKMTGLQTISGGYQIRDSREYNFDVMCLSDNILESILMSEVLYALLLGAYNVLSTMFMKIDFNMTEIIAEQSLTPTPIFFRSLRIDLASDELVSTLVDEELLHKIAFEDAGIEAIEGNNYPRLGIPGVESEII
mgnify:CR=1 FL=1